MKMILKDRLLVEQIQNTKSNSIIDVIEDENAPLTGKVLLVGKQVEDVKVNNIIKYKGSDALPIVVDGKNLFILREYDIIGIN